MKAGKNVEPFYRHLGAVVRQRRQILNMRQEDLAADVGISRPGLVNIEHGEQQRVYVHTLLELAHFLDCEPGDLLAEAQEFERLESESLEQQHDHEPEDDDGAQRLAE